MSVMGIQQRFVATIESKAFASILVGSNNIAYRDGDDGSLDSGQEPPYPRVPPVKWQYVSMERPCMRKRIAGPDSQHIPMES